jgi:thymidylate kinase
MKTLLITFSGIDGAGKSTQIAKLTSYVDAQQMAIRQLAFWDDVVMFRGLRTGFSRKVLQSDGAVGTPERPAQRNDKNTQTLPLLVGRSVLHIFDVFRLRRVVKRALRQSRGGVVIFDRYIYDQLAALPMHKWLVRSYARLLLWIAPKPDVAYLLDAIPEEARARKPEYPLEFMKNYRRSYLQLRDIAGMQLIAAGNPEQVHSAIIDGFNKTAGGIGPRSQLRDALTA